MPHDLYLCGECGSDRLAHFAGETETIRHRGLQAIVEGLAGTRCPHCGTVMFGPESNVRYCAAMDGLILQARADAGEAPVNREPGGLREMPGWEQFKLDMSIFAPMTPEEADEEGWL